MSSLTAVDMMNRTPMKKNWVKKAVKPENRGKFKAKAEAAGKSTAEFAKEKKDAPGTLGKEARLASTLMGMSHKRKKKHETIYDHPRSSSKD